MISGRIRVLDEAVINRIAAGEVIERPMSVVKELVENSLDAQSRFITVDIEQGGKKLIRVRDNGIGMSRDDAFLAIERHATSKLVSEQDLVSISTMGFRGEALASIASVSKMRLITKDHSEAAGWEICIEGGVFRKASDIGSGQGTMIEVAQLFYNVPVRRKFLKGPSLESDYIHDLLIRFALAFPSVGFKYSEDDRVKIDVPPMERVHERIHALYPKDVRENLALVDNSLGPVSISGFVGKPPFARSSMKSVLTFVNGRSVKDRVINMAVNRAFANLMERGRYPFAILFVNLPTEDVDVNVHPQKTEVRFLNPKLISDLITDGVYEAVMGFPFFANRTSEDRSFFSKRTFANQTQKIFPEQSSHFRSGDSENTYNVAAPCVDPPSINYSEQPQDLPQELHLDGLHIVGNLPGSFIVLSNENDLIVMDHHAVHERILFDQLKDRYATDRKFASQALLIPEVIELSPLEAGALRKQLAILERCGFQLEEFGEHDFIVKALPEWWGSQELRMFLDSIIREFLDTEIVNDTQDVLDTLFKMMACKGAVKETSSLRQDEIRGLLKLLAESSRADVCPHGRPLFFSIPLKEIKRKMGR